MSTGFVYPIISFSLVDYTKISIGSYFIGFNLDYSNYPLCKMDNLGQITVIGGGGGGGSGYEFYYQPGPPVPDPTTLGARWVDSDTGVEYTWVFDGDNYLWMQPTQSSVRKKVSSFINSATAPLVFTYEYYGVIYSGGICTLTLPIGVSPGDDGRSITVKDEIGGVSLPGRGILIQGNTQSIDGGPSVTINTNFEAKTFLFRNGYWNSI